MVRSGYNVSFHILDAKGVEHTVSSHKSTKNSAWNHIPHYHRIDPSGQWLATWNPKKRAVVVRALNTLNEQRPVKVSLKFIKGHVSEFRWLHSAKGFVVLAARKLWVVDYDPSKSGRRAKLRAAPIKSKLHVSIQDFRTLEGGVVMKTADHKATLIMDNSDLTQYPLNPNFAHIKQVSTRSRGRIVASVFPRFKKGQPRNSPELWTFQTHPDKAPNVVEKRSCDSECYVDNWTPGTERLVYALYDGEIVIETPDHNNAIAVYVNPKKPWLKVHTLWTNPKETQILAATHEKLKVWDNHGQPLWSWTPARHNKIRSAHFKSDGNVLVATDTHLYSVNNGVVVEKTRPLAKSHRLPGVKGPKRFYNPVGRFLDDARPLGGGAVAFSVVQRVRIRTPEIRRFKRYKSRKANKSHARRSQQQRALAF